MTNAPFRAAFWTMCCGVLLSVAMIASSPEAGQFVSALLHPELAQQSAEIAVPEVVLGQHQPLNFPVATPESEAPALVPDPYSPSDPASLAGPVSTAESAGSKWPATYVPPAVSGIRTASADPNVVLGLIEQQTPSNASEPTAVVDGTVTTPPIAVVTTAETNAMSIPVPVPVMSQETPPAFLSDQDFPEPELKRLQGSLTQLRVAQIERELAEVRSEERHKLQQLADGELSLIQDRLREFCSRFAPEMNGAVPVADQTQSQELMTLAANDTQESVATPQEYSTDPSAADERESEQVETRIKIVETDKKGEFDISIHNTDIGEVLSQLGRKLDWRVIISPEVSGKFTGEFHEADIEQVFVMVVKTHKLGVDRRGDYILIRHQPGFARP